MAVFGNLSPPLEATAQRGLTYCRNHFGSKGLKIEEGIHSSISWRPTFIIKPRAFEICAFEVNDIIFPDVIKGAAHDIRHYPGLIRVIQVCPMSAYQADKDQRKINTLRAQGFGLLTVGNEGDVVEQFGCVPLAQFITTNELEGIIRELPTALRVRVREAHKTYLVTPTKGVQDCGEILEGLIGSIARQSIPKTQITRSHLRKSAANLIDDMYSEEYFKDHRATLGGVRSFLKLYRNPASHAPKTAKEAAERVRNVREGFVNALRHLSLLAETARALQLKVIIYS